MPANNGGAAFPVVTGNESSGVWCKSEGLSLRDYFAAKALQGLLAFSPMDTEARGQYSYKSAAADAYGFADAMLAARDA